MRYIFTMKRLIFAIIFVFLSVVNVFAEYPNTSVGIIDLNKILSEAKAATDAAEQIEKIAGQIQEEINVSDEKILNEQNKLIESQDIMAPEAFEVKRIEYEKKVQNYNIERQNKLMSIDTLLAESRNQVLDALKPILEEISNEKGITILLEKNSVLLSAENMDITDEAMKKLNKSLTKIEVSLN